MATKKRKNMKKKRNTGSLILTVFLALIAAAILVYFAICLAEPIVFGEFSAAIVAPHLAAFIAR